MRKKFKKGAASFYIVAFSTLILVVIVTSFAMVIASEIARTSNDDLSQSAYDSALAGVEDAKVAFASYRRCAEANQKASNTKPVGGGDITCEDIMYWVEKMPEDEKCYMVGRILGKIGKDEKSEVAIGGKKTTSNGGKTETTTNQAYTCVFLNTSLNDYRATLDANTRIRTMRASVGNSPTNNVKMIRFSWYSVRKDNQGSLSYDFSVDDKKKLTFPAFKNGNTYTIPVPPMIEFQIVQTKIGFKLSDFDIIDIDKTDRAFLYLVPTEVAEKAKNTGNNDNYIGIYNGSTNVVNKSNVVKTNDQSVKNKAFLTYCSPRTTSDWYCSVDIELPEPIGGARSNDTFMLSVSLPYQQPDTDFSIELICDEGKCGEDAVKVEGGFRATISNTQISIDSTGRANDLYRRVETRLETADATFGAGYPYYALEILGDSPTEKKMNVSYEGYFEL